MTYTNAHWELLAYQKAIIDGRERETIDNLLKVLNTYSVYKVSYILMVDYMLISISGSLDQSQKLLPL